MINQPSPELSRTALLLGSDAMARLAAARVVVVGLGAVGSYAVEGLARAGIGCLRVVDFDVVKRSNINRQLFALSSTLHRPKVEVAAERLRDINPDLAVEPVNAFAHVETLDELLADNPDAVVDAIDSLSPKVELLSWCSEHGIPAYSALGAATRMDADRVRFGELFSAKGCPLGRQVRKRLRKRGITGGDLWCVYSDEERNLDAVRAPGTCEDGEAESEEYRRGRERDTLGSLSTVTGLFGLRLAHEVVLRLARPH